MKDREKKKAHRNAVAISVYSNEKKGYQIRKELRPLGGKKQTAMLHNRRYSSVSVSGIALGQVADCRCGDRTLNPLPSDDSSLW